VEFRVLQDVCGTSNDDTLVSGSYYLPWLASDGHSDVVTTAVSTHHRTTRVWDSSPYLTTQSASDFSSSELHYTADRGFGSGGSLPSSCHWADLFSDHLRPWGSRSRAHSGSYFRHKDKYSSTSSASGFLFSNLVRSGRRHWRRRRLWFLCSTFEDSLYLVARSFLSTSAGLDSFLVLVAKGGDR
jgi:hypothetical protein